MENTKENRLKFYAQHLGQNIIIDSDCFRSENGNDIIHTTLVSVSLKGIECDGWIPETEHTALDLKPLSLITDEDSLKVAEIFDLDKSQIEDTNLLEWIEGLYNEVSGYYIDGYTGNQLLSGSDFIRAKGYALSWMGLSVEKLQEYGWIKLKSE